MSDTPNYFNIAAASQSVDLHVWVTPEQEVVDWFVGLPGEGYTDDGRTEKLTQKYGAPVTLLSNVTIEQVQELNRGDQ